MVGYMPPCHTRHPTHAATGTYAEYVSTPEKRLMAIPDSVSFETAAAMPMAGLTAWQALSPSMPLAGKRVLVHGGSGGIGHLAVQVDRGGEEGGGQERGEGRG